MTIFDRVKSIFLEACELPDQERDGYLDRACGSNTTLRERVEELLRHDAAPSPVVDRIALDAGARLTVESIFEEAARGPDSPIGPARSVPDRIGKYRIVRLIGEGGMGVVYEAIQEDLERRVALKVIRPGMVTPRLLRRFRHEAQMLGQLKHSGIAQIYETGTAEIRGGVQPFFAMELVEGRPLLEFADAQHLDTRARLELIARIGDALQHAHQKGIMHRDLKPANILVEGTEAQRHEGTKGHISSASASGAGDSQSLRAPVPSSLRAFSPKILDFGIARMTDSDLQTVSLHTDAGQLLGTIQYMSPEQAKGDAAQIDARSDVYSLGVTAYELLTGRLPYPVRGKLIHEAVRIIQENEPSRLSSVDRGLRGDIETIIAKALEKEPARRYQSAAEFAADIRRYLADQPVHARPASMVYQLRKFARRNKPLAAGISLAFGAMLIATVLSLWYAGEANEARRRADLEAARTAREAARANIAAAAAALESNDNQTTTARLHAIPEHLRNFEWHRLHALLEQSIVLLGTDEPLVGASMIEETGEILALNKHGILARYARDSDIALSTIQLGITDPLAFAATSDGKFAVIADSEPAEVTLLNASSGRLIRTLGNAPPSFVFLDISDNGERIACGGRRGAIQVWNASTEAPATTITQQHHLIDLKFTRDGEWLLVAAHDIVDIYDAETGAMIHHFVVRNGGTCAAITQDRRTIISGGDDKQVHETDVEQDVTRDIARGHTGVVREVALSADDSLVVSAASDRTLRIGPLASGESSLVVRHWRGGGVYEMALSSDSTRLLTLHGPEGTARVWNATTESSDVMAGHRSFVYAIEFTADGSRAVSAAWDGTIRIWEPHSGDCLGIIGSDDDFVTAIAVSPDGSMIACGRHRDLLRRSRIQIWSADTGELLFEDETLVGEITSVAFSPDGARLFAASQHRPLAVCEVNTWERISDFTIEPAIARAIAFSQDGRWLATSHDDNSVHIRDPRDGSTLHRLTGHANIIRNLCFSPDGQLLASASDDRTARLWRVADGACLATLQGHWDAVYAAAFSPDGTRLATGSRDTTIRLWDVEHHEEVAQLRGHDQYVYSLAFSPDGSMLLSASGDGDVRRWDAVPLHQRWRERNCFLGRRQAMGGRMLDLLAAHSSPQAVAHSLRNDPDLSQDDRNAALAALLEQCLRAPRD